ncbi:hypothetical protein [uncultured Eubacterium sp.]|uniref:hypothetical protein n=1 Tax=uncultured Eubacterium sp. TaxID=165185 RepID=UPI003265F468
MYRIIIDGQYVPIPPEKITIKVDGDNKTMTLINLGEINVIRKKKLTDISFELLLPNQQYPFAYYPQGYMTADSYIKKYRRLQREKSPFKLEIYRYTPNGKNMFNTILNVTLEKLTITDSVSDGFDNKVSLEFKEYKKYGATTIRKKSATYTVKSNKETLTLIAKKWLKDSSKAQDIYKKNKKVIEKAAKEHKRKSSSKGKYLYKGTVLKKP